LWKVKAETNEEAVFQLLGLHWAGEPAEKLAGLAKALRQRQRKDGGWAQLPKLESDAYATGEVLYTLARFVRRMGRDDDAGALLAQADALGFRSAETILDGAYRYFAEGQQATALLSIQEAAERLGIVPHFCLALEDSLNGVRSASSAGMMTIMVPDLLQPTYEIRQLCALVAVDLVDLDVLERRLHRTDHGPALERRELVDIASQRRSGRDDHVDAHRSIAFEISKYSPSSAAHPFVDSRFYTTVNMVHTMESLLGLPPMNQNDAYAPVMAPLFSGPGDHPPFTADWSNRDTGLIYQTNTPKQSGAKQSAKMNFTRPDAINTALLNKILWHDRKGDLPMPEPKHTVLPQTRSRDDD
jgi:hypothetical protein